MKFILVAHIIIFLYLLPLLIFGQDSHIRIHDNLDSNFVYRDLLAHSGKIFSSSATLIDNIMNGLPRISLRSEFSVPLLFHYLFKPFVSHVIMQFFIHFVAFWGFYLLLRGHFLTDKKDGLINVGVALCFALIPFWPPGFLSIAGIPLILNSFLNIRKKEDSKVDWIILCLIPFCSSFVISFFIFFFIGGLFVYDFIKFKNINFKYLLALLLFFGIYVLVEYRLFYSTFIEPVFVSHRMEYVRHNGGWPNFVNRFKEILFDNKDFGGTAGFFNRYYIWASVVIGFFVVLIEKRKYLLKYLLLLMAILFIDIIYASYNAGLATILNNLSVTLNGFNFSRFIVFLPVLWYLLFALALYVITISFRNGRYLCLLLIGLQVFYLFYYNPELEGRRINEPTFKGYFSETLFNEIKKEIPLSPEEYRVISLGMHPSVALYNGLYVLDAYMNNYPLEYKHAFRKIIEKELDKNAYLKSSFDNSAARCYLLTNEFPSIFFTIYNKKDLQINDLELNVEAFEDIASNKQVYIISAVEIVNFAKNNLEFLGDFETRDSPYKIRLYNVL